MSKMTPMTPEDVSRLLDEAGEDARESLLHRPLDESGIERAAKTARGLVRALGQLLQSTGLADCPPGFLQQIAELRNARPGFRKFTGLM